MKIIITESQYISLLKSTKKNVEPLIFEQKERATTKPDISKIAKGALFGDLSKSFKNVEVVTGSYSAKNQSNPYDALHSFHMRASDKFGGRINTKVKKAIKDFKKKNNIKAVDIKNMKVNIDENTLTVDWSVTIVPSSTNKTYEGFDSRGSAGGGESAVNKQLDKMHSYNSGTPELLYHFNKTINVCFDSRGIKLKNGCKGKINIQQKFYKYGKTL